MLPRRFGPVALLVAALAVSLAPPLRGQETDLDKKVKELNAITGNAVIVGEYKWITDDSASAKKLVHYAREALQKDKNVLTYNAAFILAEVAKKYDDLPAAEAFYRVCMKDAAKLESTTKLVQSYGALIDLLYENNKFGESARVCRELLELDTGPGKPRTVLIPLTTRFGTETFTEETNFDAVRRIKPGVHRLLIQALAKQGKFDQALKLVGNLLDSTKNHWQELQLKAWVLRESGKYQEAAQVYEDVLKQIGKDKELEPEERGITEDRVRYILSNVYVDLNKMDKANEQLRALINRHPNESGYYNDLGYILADHDMQLDEAEKLIRKAIDLDRERRKKDSNLSPAEDRDNGAYLDSLGWVLFKKKDFKGAREWLEKAVADKRAQHIEIYDHLGDTLMALGDRQGAVSAWKRGLEFVTQSSRDQRRKEEVQKKLQKHAAP